MKFENASFQEEPLEVEIGNDTITTQFEKPSVLVETRPAAGGSFEMLVHIGPEERVLPLGEIDFETARGLHHQAVGFLRGRLAGIEAVARATADALAHEIKQKLQ